MAVAILGRLGLGIALRFGSERHSLLTNQHRESLWLRPLLFFPCMSATPRRSLWWIIDGHSAGAFGVIVCFLWEDWLLEPLNCFDFYRPPLPEKRTPCFFFIVCWWVLRAVLFTGTKWRLMNFGRVPPLIRLAFMWSVSIWLHISQSVRHW